MVNRSLRWDLVAPRPIVDTQQRLQFILKCFVTSDWNHSQNKTIQSNATDKILTAKRFVMHSRNHNYIHRRDMWTCACFIWLMPFALCDCHLTCDKISIWQPVCFCSFASFDSFFFFFFLLFFRWIPIRLSLISLLSSNELNINTIELMSDIHATSKTMPGRF